MATKDDFYIGWKKEAPSSYHRTVRAFVIVATVLVVAVAGIAVLAQRGFIASVFEFGQISTIEGTLVRHPIPLLHIQEGDSVRTILMVGFGKMGAGPTIDAIEERIGESLAGKVVRLRGSRIYYSNRELLELTEGADSFVEFVPDQAPVTVTSEAVGDAQFLGEIYDAKCAFGVMKPGYGKPHRSCAVRCVSGGVPPVLRGLDASGNTVYSLVVGLDGLPANERVLPYLADQIRICGRLERQADWLVLYTDPSEDILRLQPHWVEGEIPMCN